MTTGVGITEANCHGGKKPLLTLSTPLRRVFFCPGTDGHDDVKYIQELGSSSATLRALANTTLTYQANRLTIPPRVSTLVLLVLLVLG
jgi:hypothetical protein